MFFNWLRPAPRRRPNCALRHRPCLEALEDRVTPSTFTVKNLRDVDASLAPIKNSLRWAAEKANATPGADKVVFKPGLKGTLHLGGGPITISDSVLIDGPGARSATIDAGQTSSVFFISDNDVAVARKVTIQDLTLAHGENVFVGGALLNFESLKLRNLVFKENAAGSGGAVYSEGNLAINDCVFAGNFAGLDTAGGGAIHSTGANLRATRTRFVGNTTAGHGGAILADNDVTLVDCLVAGNNAEETGGGISNILGQGTHNLTIVRSRINGNVAGSGGGGIFHKGGAQVGQGIALLNQSTVRGNIGRDGGGIFASNAIVKRSTLADNRAEGGSGGGLAGADAFLVDCTISGNVADANGGGLLGTSATFSRCTISGNSAIIGGGVYLKGATLATQRGALTNCTISGNSASNIDTSVGFGGGIFCDGVPLVLSNSTVSGNTAANLGGGIYAQNQTLDLLNVTVVKNFAGSAGGIYHEGAAFPATMRNTIVALNRVGPGGSSPDLSGPFVSLGHNLIGDSSDHPAFINGVNGDQVGQPGKPLNPRIGRLADNGGRTRTHALLPGSPAIDKGDNVDAPRKDQRGVRRPRDGDGRRGRVVDIGAFER